MYNDKNPSLDKQKPTKKFMQLLEQTAQSFRRELELGDYDRLAPLEHTKKLNLQIFYPEDILKLPIDKKDEIAKVNAKTWSGASNKLPNGEILIILNPHQTRERANVTILEEIFHIRYGHKPSRISATGIREYRASDEQEAYWTAAAAMLPAAVIARAVWQKQPAIGIAQFYGTSLELVEMRIKTLQLWKHYIQFNKERRVI